MNYYVCGKITNTHALKGALKVKNLSDFDRFYKGSFLYIQDKEEYIKVEVLKKVDNKDFLLVTFKNLEDINLVEKYKGCLVYIKEEDMKPLSNDEYYHHELIGKNLINEDGINRGVVSSVKEVPQGHLLCVVVNDRNKYIPFRKEFILNVDEDNIYFVELEGLL